VNAWFGSFDKYEGSRAFFSQVLGLDEQEMLETGCYCGDAPNDQVMFSHFPLSFGVGNIKKRVDSMQFLPTYVAENEGGEGFAEIVDALLAKRQQDL
jgi:3-deoxy-D-manno-octulosonate 8-phosphate phosphatase KdsC-like HAD superfamily phosphatase